MLEGVERAERNVLPVLNNLLENREMALEDGRFLVAPRRWDELQHSGSLQGATRRSRGDHYDPSECCLLVTMMHGVHEVP